MSEKRFKLTTEEDICYCEYTYWKGDEPLGMEEVVDVLNEQDDELHKYRTENAELHITILENEKEIDEQQATISQLKQEINEWKKENRELLDLIYSLQLRVVDDE